MASSPRSPRARPGEVTVMTGGADAVVQIGGPWAHRSVSANGTRFHAAEAGDGPLVLLLHGFPEFWWTWRHQLAVLPGAGYRAVAVDLRGYGGSDKPPRGYDLGIAAPVLHLHGAMDTCVLPQTARGAGRYVDGPYRWRVIDGAGHFPHEERPEVLDTELLGWLADPEPER